MCAASDIEAVSDSVKSKCCDMALWSVKLSVDTSKLDLSSSVPLLADSPICYETIKMLSRGKTNLPLVEGAASKLLFGSAFRFCALLPDGPCVFCMNENTFYFRYVHHPKMLLSSAVNVSLLDYSTCVATCMEIKL